MSIQKRQVPVYCISLRDQHGRRENIRQKTPGLSITFIDAVDTRGDKWERYAHRLTDEGIQQMQYVVSNGARKRHSDLTPGAVGCFLSHLYCYQYFLETSTSDYLVILEDDSDPRESFAQHLQDILQNIPPDADMCMIHHEIHGSAVYSPSYPHYLILHEDSRFFRTNCYIISRKGAKKIIGISGKFHDQIDSYMSRLIQNGILRVYFWHDNTICPPWDNADTSIQTSPVM